MKSSAKSKIIVLITLGILFALLPLITVNLSFISGNSNKSSEYSDDSNLDNKNPKISEVSGKIHIANNWTAAKAAGICTGSGNYTHPYIIEDLVIDAGGSGSCIRIENSDFYFRIENCTLYNSGWSHPNAGIHLYNVDNGALIDNNCSSNFYGIYFSSSDNNTISGNNISNSYYGIYLSGVNNTLAGNRMVECGLKIYGYLEEMSIHIIDASNLVNGKPLYYYADEDNLGPNNFTNAGQIILVNCEHSLIFNLNVSNGSTGISLYYCDNNNISENIANNNNDNGIYLRYSDNNYISENNANNNYNGLYLDYSHGNNLSRNTANNNTEYGIFMYSSWSPTHEVSHISENNASHNYYGIYLYYFQGAIISGNNVSLNYYGLYLGWGSRENNVLGNNISFNNYGIFLGVDNNIILGNIVDNNEIGISLWYCQSNTIQQNVISNNDIGIDIYFSKCNIISDNIFSGNIIDIRGTQDECNPFPLGFVIAIVVPIVFIAIVVTGRILKKRRVTKGEFARYYKRKEQKIQVIEVLEEKEKPVLVKIEPSKSTVEQTLLKEESIKEVVKEPISPEILEEKEKPVPVKIEPSQPKILNCVFCGMEVDAERNFCQRCGHKQKKS